MHILKKNFKLLLLAVFVAVASCSFTTKDFNDPDRENFVKFGDLRFGTRSL